MSDDRRALDDVSFSRDGTLVITEYDDATTRIWNATTGAPVASETLEQSGVAGLDGPVLTITAGAPNISGEGLYGIRDVVFSDGGRLLMAVEEEGGASAWQIPTLVLHERLSTYDAVPKEVREVRSPDDRIVVELGDTAAIVDRASGRRLGELPLAARRCGRVQSGRFEDCRRRRIARRAHLSPGVLRSTGRADHHGSQTRRQRTDARRASQVRAADSGPVSNPHVQARHVVAGIALHSSPWFLPNAYATVSGAVKSLAASGYGFALT
jgi:hypothetical protein